MDNGATIPYISHIGAEGIKPLFIAGSAVTVVFMDLALLSERWLRHAGQLARNKGRFDKTCAVGSILFSIAGAVGLILLSVFDTKNHNKLHHGFLGMFMYEYLPISRENISNWILEHATWSALSWCVWNTSILADSTTRKPGSYCSASVSKLFSSSANLLSRLHLAYA
ncbi:Frag1/DRAM/Sfk1 [Penicillium cf. griseofulvum]|nr:Frag1/DRAM/Sfk1 [Penicillium cf. griseofulvum]